MVMPSSKKFDVAIIGGGIAGVAAASQFLKAGVSVALIDEREEAAPFFRAERVSNQSIQKLIDWGHREEVEAVSLPMPETAFVKGSQILKKVAITDYSIPLWKLVNEMRSKLMNSSDFERINDKAGEVVNSPGRQQITLQRSGDLVDCKLMVVATGSGNAFLKTIGVSRRIISKNHSSTFGFDIIPGDGFQLPSASVTVRICKNGADYMNLFPIPEGGYRANLFTYWPAGDERQKAFIKGNTSEELRKLLPKIEQLTGEWTVGDRVDCGSVSVMKSANYQRPGFVLIGDAYGRVCPCAGRGINKALNDVETLLKVAPQWIAEDTPLIAENLDSYYNDPERAAYEEWVYNDSLAIRERVLSNHPVWIARRVWYHYTPQPVKNLVGLASAVFRKIGSLAKRNDSTGEVVESAA